LASFQCYNFNELYYVSKFTWHEDNQGT
jgi:hypothetical protein